MAKKAITKGKRYTIEEKKKVIDFVSAHDAEKGRGGVAAATREFGITPLTITAWKKKFGSDVTTSKTSASKKRGATSQSRALHRLGEILDEIAVKNEQIAQLKKEYDKLKKNV